MTSHLQVPSTVPLRHGQLHLLTTGESGLQYLFCTSAYSDSYSPGALERLAGFDSQAPNTTRSGAVLLRNGSAEMAATISVGRCHLLGAHNGAPLDGPVVRRGDEHNSGG